MTDKELKRLRRAELLELLIGQVKENESLIAKVEELTAQLRERAVIIQEAGSLAEAVLRLNGVFQAADDAAKQYLDNRIQETDRRCAQMEQETKARCEQMLEQLCQRTSPGESPSEGKAGEPPC